MNLVEAPLARARLPVVGRPLRAAAPAETASSFAVTEAVAVSPQELVACRPDLLRYARRHLTDAAQAEDAVHDVFEAVLSGRAAFHGRSALRSWLTGILKHKIVDLLRRRRGEESLDSPDHGADGDEGSNGLHQLACPAPRPDQQAESRQQLAWVLSRIESLPQPLREALYMSVLQELPTAEVCQRLSISEGNLFVRLHRARRQLLS